jgi:hypothetical protein
VQLYANQTTHLPVRTVIVDQHAHDVAVQNLSKRVATRDDMVLVPVSALDERFQFRDITQRTHNAGFLSLPDVCELPAQSQKSTTSFFVNLAGKPCVSPVLNPNRGPREPGSLL